MAKSFYDKYYKDVPPVFKGILNVLVVGGAAYIGWELYRNYKRKQEEGEADQAATQAAGELPVLASQGITPTYSTAQFENWSQALVQAMTGCGTDEDVIYTIFGMMRNDADVLKLIQVFGVRYYQPCAWTSPISYAQWQINDKAFGGGLPTWLGYDLGSGEIRSINNILAGRNINYQF